MKQLFIGLLTTLILAGCSGTQTSGGAGSKVNQTPRVDQVPVVAGAAQINILILGEDSAGDSVPRNSRVFRRVLDALANQLGDQGFSVYDETAVTLDDFAQGRVRRSDAEIIDIARSVRRPPIDVAVIFTIYTATDPRGYSTKVDTRVEGRLLKVHEGKRLGNFELDSPASWSVAPSCRNACLLESVGDHARTLAADIGAVLSMKLSSLVAGDHAATGDSDSHEPTSAVTGRDRHADNDKHLPAATGAHTRGLVSGYNLVLDGFRPQEVAVIEERLVRLPGYQSHRSSYAGQTRTEFWYESSISTAKLNRSINGMLGALDLPGLVQFSGNTLTVKKITLRGKRAAAVDDDW